MSKKATRFREWAIRIVLTLIIALCANTLSAEAQLFPDSSKRINTEFIPDSAFASAVVFPKNLADDPNFDAFPREIVTAWGKKELGFDPMLINQITFVVKKMDGLNRPPQWGAILHFEEMQGLAGKLINRLEEKKVGGKPVFSGTAVGMPSFLVFDEATMFVGDEAFFQDMVTSDKSGTLVALIKNAEVKGQVRAFVDIESVRPMLNEAMLAMPGMLPPAITKLKQIPNMIDAVEIGIKADGRVKSTVVFHASDAEVAADVSKIVKDALDFGTEMMIGLMAAQMDFNDPVQEATVEYVQRVAADYKQKLTPSVNGSDLTVHLDEEATIVPVLIGMLLPAVQQTRHAARRSQSMNNCRQMTLASLNYESAYGHFPTQASYDANGKPLLSWRVHVLPFIEQQELYEQFHLDEPWDSPHNKKLIKRMPPVYRSPSVNDLGGKTVYLGIAGEGMMFGKDKRTFGNITDGSSNTALLVEADPDHAVVWTKPEDLEVDRENPLKGLGNVNPGGFIVNFADGSVHFIRSDVDEKTWLNLMTIGDGNVINAGDF